MSQTPGIAPETLDGTGLHIAVVQARFNPQITDGLWKACKDTLIAHGVHEDDIFHVSVPGALEIPVALQRLAISGEFDALVALGAVVKGGTYHFELVCNESAAGVTRVSLDFGIPVANAVLTTFTEEQAVERIEEKGSDAARAAIEMAGLMIEMDELLPSIHIEGEDD
ncbi:MAG: 6,7-dimethyl-8-ribityllumazine synthase [Burkholderiales bacterium]|jgi:6,7-dimethyl-8-ribityllumazine synthase|nr:6,7-dimethyl-8-ribityllumazine synthase [Burkholderiales bacterium]